MKGRLFLCSKQDFNSAIKFLSIIIFFFSCKNSTDNNVDNLNSLDWQINKIDSLQVLYYDDPNGDSLRYSRFYRFTSLSDSTAINQLIKNLQQPFETLPGKRDCRSDGKIYAYKKDEVVKTIYFNTTNSKCYYLYFIKDGAFIYFKLDDAFQVILTDLRKNAVAPKAITAD